ncbi:MAG: hypothetical protein HY286_16760 [Planctomycetes bacterium]|nr:hypothetical protein [Planctomycetota bacterium]
MNDSNMNDSDRKRFDSSGECPALAPILVRASVEKLTSVEEERVAAHLATCESCLHEAMQLGDFVASLRTWNASIGGPSPRFAARLKSRLAAERANVARPAVGASGTIVNLPGIESEPPAPKTKNPIRTKQRSKALAVALVISVAMNVGILWAYWRGNVRAAEPPVDSNTTEIAAASDAPVVPESVLASRLQKLRGAQGGDGLVGGDPVATAWWLIAESRAERAQTLQSRAERAQTLQSRANGGLTLQIDAPAAGSVARAQNALIGAAMPSDFSRAITVAGLRESVERLDSGPREDIENAIRNISRPREKHASMFWSGRSPAASQLESARGGAPEPTPNLNEKTWEDLTKGDVNSSGFLTELFTEVFADNPRAAALELLPKLSNIKTDSLRAEALCAVATASMLPRVSH